jgi:hypothetical protein
MFAPSAIRLPSSSEKPIHLRVQLHGIILAGWQTSHKLSSPNEEVTDESPRRYQL